MSYLTPISFGGSTIDSGSWRALFAPADVEGSAEVRPITMEVMGDYPAYVDVSLESRRFALWLLAQGSADFATHREEVTQMFNPELGLKTLVAEDGSGSRRQIDVQPIAVRPHPKHPNGFVVILEAPDPVWESTCQFSTSACVTATGTSLTITPSGNAYALPEIEIVASCPKSSSNVARNQRAFIVKNNLSWRLRGYPLEVTGGGWDTTGLVTAGSMRADGADIRVIWRGQEVDRWVDNPNSTSTLVWIVAFLLGGEEVQGAITFGDLSASEPEVDSSREPIFDHAESSNSKWVYKNFGTEFGTRRFSWHRGYDGPGAGGTNFDWAWISQTSASMGSWGLADPWTDMGIRKRNDARGSLVNQYSLGLPVGISSIIFEGARRLEGAGSKSRFQGLWRTASGRGSPPTIFWDDTVDTASAWTAFGPRTDTFSPCARSVTFRITTPYIGASSPTPDDYGAYISAACVVLTSYPTVTASPESSVYHLTASIVNSSVSPSQSIALDAMISVGDKVTVRTKEHEVENETSSCWLNNALTPDTLRRDWLPLVPGASQQLTYYEDDVVGVNLTVKWRNRWL